MTDDTPYDDEMFWSTDPDTTTPEDDTPDQMPHPDDIQSRTIVEADHDQPDPSLLTRVLVAVRRVVYGRGGDDR